eukprot:Sspe_Gene.5829::Locus_1941_Transcript_2_2_Confidence_0.500_Length_1129::g.5829::m.5829
MSGLARFCPSKEESIKILKQLGSAALGMVGALALNEALKQTFKSFGPAGILSYALLVSFISIVILAIMKLQIEARAERSGGERAKALLQLFKVSFCLLSASAWNELINESDDEWLLLGIAIGLTVGLVILLILTFKLYDAWQSGGCRSKLHWIPAGLINGFLVGLVMWVPVTFGFVCGVAWNSFFTALIKGNMDSEGMKILVAFVYALITVPLAIAIILIAQKVRENGWGSCCPSPVSQPCCGLENKIAEPLCSMFQGEASAIMAFAWNEAFVAIWSDTTSSDSPEDSNDPNIGILIAYALVATIVGIVAVLLVKRCTGH